jgi:hypothetical protein
VSVLGQSSVAMTWYPGYPAAGTTGSNLMLISFVVNATYTNAKVAPTTNKQHFLCEFGKFYNSHLIE